MPKTIQQLLQSSKKPSTIFPYKKMVLDKMARLDAELLLAHALGKSREFVLTHTNHLITLSQYHLITRLFKKRAQGIPLAYLTGHKEFFGLDFFVNKNVLIPRPDTEILVESVINHIHNSKFLPRRQAGINHNSLLIDVGTGSGCIPIAIAETIRKSGLFPKRNALWVSVIRNFYAIDISRKALRVARKNAKKHGVNITFLHGNLLSPLINQSTIKLINQSNIIITANLPYLTEEQFTQEPSIQYEPRLALVAKESGLALYHELLKQIRQFYSLFSAQGGSLPAGRHGALGGLIPYSLFFEINPSQSLKIKTLIKKYLPNAKIEIKKDLAGLDRVLLISIT